MTRPLLPLLALLAPLVAACGPSTGGDPYGAPPGADAGPDAAVCEPVPTCDVVLSAPAGSATTMELRGDWAPGAWEAGAPMVRDGDRFVVTLEGLPADTTFQYKFVVDGTTWIEDPENDARVIDGYGGHNSVALVRCDECPRESYDWRDAVMYFVLVDRFLDGDPSNNAPLADVPTAANYQGGDLAGVLQKIEEGYFGGLGVNVLWLSAPFRNADAAGIGTSGNLYSSYHGYWPTDLEAIDSRIGDLPLLRQVVAAAHARGIRVVLDYVMNHVHEESALWTERTDWFWPLEDCICGGGCSWDDEPDRLRCWFTPYLPTFDFRNDAARYYSVSNAVDWIKATGVDGFRLDAIKHVEMAWLTDLRARLDVEIDPTGRRFYLVGETFTGDRDLLKAYIDPATKLDGQFDFPLRASLARTVLRGEGELGELMGFLDGNDAYYGAGAIMGTFVGNHDLPRPIHLAEDPPLFGEWDGGGHRAWSNQPGLPATAEPFERLALAYAVLMTIPGVPLIYYGDEIGMPGAGDPDNRRMMQWDGLSTHQLWLRDQIAALARVRAEQSALRRGRRVTRSGTEDTAVYALVEANRPRVYVALNRGDGPREVTGIPAGTYLDLLTDEVVSSPFTVPARGYLLLAPGAP
jgi:glycosidase